MERGKTAEWMTYQPLDIRAVLVCMGSPKDMRSKGCLRRYILTHSRATCSGSNVSDVRTKVEGRIAYMRHFTSFSYSTLSLRAVFPVEITTLSLLWQGLNLVFPRKRNNNYNMKIFPTPPPHFFLTSVSWSIVDHRKKQAVRKNSYIYTV